MNEFGKLEPLTEREFKSTIPPHLVDKLSDGERYLVEGLSRLEEQYKWMFQQIVGHQHLLIDVYDTLTKAHDWQGGIDDWRKNCAQRMDALDKTATDTASQNKLLWDWKNTVIGKTGIMFWIATILIPVILKFIFDLWVKKP